MESEAEPGTPGGARGGGSAEGARREGGPDRQTDSEGERGGSEPGSARGRYCLPPTEEHRAVEGPWMQLWDHPELGWCWEGLGGDGLSGCNRGKLILKDQPPPGEALPGRSFCLLRGAARGAHIKVR